MATEDRGGMSTGTAWTARAEALAGGIKQFLFGSERDLGPPILQPGSQFLLLPFGP